MAGKKRPKSKSKENDRKKSPDLTKPAAVLGFSRDITERKLADKKIRQQAEVLALINSLNSAANRGESLQKILNMLVKETKKIFSGYGATIYLLSENKENLITQNFEYPSTLKKRIEKIIGKKIPKTKIQLKDGCLYREILRKGIPVLINDQESIQTLMAEHTENKMLKKLVPAIYRILNIGSVIVVPLTSSDDSIGLLDISRKEPFSETDMQRITFISQHLFSILKRKEIEEKIRKSEEQLNALFQASKDGIVVEKDGVIVYANISFLKLHGYKNDRELIGKSITTTISPDDCKKMNEYGNKRRKGLDAPLYYEFKGMKKDGSIFDAEISVSVYSIDDDKYIVGFVRDITGRKRAETELKRNSEHLEDMVEKRTSELKESEEKYRTLIENIPSRIFLKDTNQNYISCNVSFAEDLGITSEEIAGKTDYDFFPKELAGKYRADDKRILKSGKTEEIEEKYVKKGEDLWVHTIKTPVRDKKGKITGILGIFWDITERKRMEDTLRESETKYSAVVENSIDSIIIVQDKIIKFVNSAIVELSGYNFDELIGKEIQNFIAPRERESIMKRYSDRLSGKEVPTMYELNIVRKDGTTLPIEVSNTIITFDGEEATLSFLRDTSERRKAVEALTESEEKYRTLFEHSPESITLIDIDGTVLDCNDAAELIMGIPAKEIIGSSVLELDFFFEEDILKMSEIFKQLITGVDVGNLEVKLRQGEEKAYWAEVFSTPLRKDGEIYAIQVITRDITERKARETEMRNRLLKFDIENGNLYLVQEPRLLHTLEIFSDLLYVGYPGLVISRTPSKNLKNKIERPFEFMWVSERAKGNSIKPRPALVEKFVEQQGRGMAILIDCLEYLISKVGFKPTLSLVQSLRDIAYLKDHVLLIIVDPTTLSEREMRLLEKECLIVASQKALGKVPEKLLDILRFVNKENLAGTTPSYTDVETELSISKPTVRKRINELASMGCIKVIQKGRTKYLDITEKGKTYMVIK